MTAFDATRRSAAALFFLGPVLATTPVAAAPKQAKKTPAQPTGPEPRVGFTAEEQQLAAVPGFPDARFFADSEKDFLQATEGTEGAWLALSGGGEDGAFGAGLLAGLGARGERPDFRVVTGSSTGALMAPYVFLGAKYDEVLRKNYTGIHAGDIFELIATPESLFDTWPLKKLVANSVTPELLAQIANEHRAGRRLFVVTTNLDAGRPVLWNMGAIAARGGDKAVQLFRDVLVASSSIPGFFPPVQIAVEANGKRFTEMHADGTIRAPFYVAPESLLTGSTARLPGRQVYVLVNSKLSTDFQITERSLPGVLGRSIAIALRSGLRSEILRVGSAAERQGIEFQVAIVPSTFTHEARGAFDPDYMQALFDLGVRQSQTSNPFAKDVFATATRATSG